MEIKVGRKYVTRAGDTATVLRNEGGYQSWPYKGTVRFSNFTREFGWDVNGKCSTCPTSLDLVKPVGLDDYNKVQKLKEVLCDDYASATEKLSAFTDLVAEFENDDDCC
jgi:hypothetical protein